MIIRTATLQDVSRVLDLERASPLAAHWNEQGYREAVAPPAGGSERLLLVAQFAGSRQQPANASDLAGFIVARHLAPEWELENIVVADSARRTGIGTRLLNALLAQAQETRSASIFLEVRESNAAARILYEKAGFQQTGCRKAYYSLPTEDAILYRRQLPEDCAEARFF